MILERADGSLGCVTTMGMGRNELVVDFLLIHKVFQLFAGFNGASVYQTIVEHLSKRGFRPPVMSRSGGGGAVGGGRGRDGGHGRLARSSVRSSCMCVKKTRVTF